MLDNIDDLKRQIKDYKINSEKDCIAFKLRFLSKKGLISALFTEFKSLPAEKKQLLGKPINDLKVLANKKLSNVSFNEKKLSSSAKYFDLSRPVTSGNLGGSHPLSIIQKKIISIFGSLGFSLSEGPEIETDWYNFSALNLPQEHPARDMQDTFFINVNPDVLLRTHTSSVQIRYMEKNSAPIRILSPGRVYRNEAVSSRSNCFFHQIEGLYIDEGVSFKDLKTVLNFFVKEFFGEKTSVRFRPSYFPFTEPSAELDISCGFCKSSGCSICKDSGYLEILGCGMVDSNVLENCGIDSEKYTGFAFGMGIERIAMLKYQVPDLRMFFENDIRFLKQFSSL